MLASTLALTSCAAKRPVAVVAPPSAGETQFQSYCAACHRYDDVAGGEAPPLDDSPWVAGPESRLIKIVLHGVEGRMEIRGQVYDREMPGFGQVLSDADVATLLSYVRERFAGLSEPVAPETVARIRAQTELRTGYWSVEELLDSP